MAETVLKNKKLIIVYVMPELAIIKQYTLQCKALNCLTK